MASVYWTVRAERRLRCALARELAKPGNGSSSETKGADGKRSALQEWVDRLSSVVADTFKDATAVVVQDRVSGFRLKAKLHVLLVEVFGSAQRGPYVIKIGPQESIQAEARAWKSCRPPAIRHDLVFLPLETGPDPSGPPSSDTPRLMSIVYGDAQQFIGVNTTIPLEKAVLRSVRFGFPTPSSIGFVLLELFERLGHVMYAQSFVDNPAEWTDETRETSGLGGLLGLKYLEENLRCWDEDTHLGTIRRDAALAKQDSSRRKTSIWYSRYQDAVQCPQYQDPVRYLRYIDNFVQQQSEPDENARHTFLADPTIGKLVPRMLRGCAHGDLHGRNVLVGIVRDRALWPAVFDYEDMGPRNLIGWDFVKLETELKIRAYSQIYHAKPSSDTAADRSHEEFAFVSRIRRFEIALNELTETHHRLDNWPQVADVTKPVPDVAPLDAANSKQDGRRVEPEDRLRAILIQLRHMAYLHLGVNRGRPKEWLEEYYFLLTCYGVCTGLFSNMQVRESLGAYLSAGIAAARLTWPRECVKCERDFLGL